MKTARAWFSLTLALWSGILFAAEPPAAVPAGFYVIPSFSFSELYNDNILLTPNDRKGDFITRLSPGITAGYESAPLTLLGGYTFDGEIFAHNSALNDAMARQKADFDFRYLPTRLLTLALKGEYLETQTPGELNVRTGIPSGRRRADRFLLDPSVAYRFDPLTTGTTGYTFTKDRLSGGGITTDTHVGRLGVERRFTRQDLGSLEYTYRQFIFGGDDTTDSHAITPGWTRELTPATSLTLKAGPRFSEGSVDAEIGSSIRHRFREGEVSLSYSRSQTAVAGEAGSATTDGVMLTLKYKVLPLLEFGAAPAFFRTARGPSDSKVYRIKFDATYEITRWLSLVGSYEYSFQKGILPGAVVAGGRHAEIPNNILFLKLEIKDRFRVF